MTTEELREILEAHNLWRKSGGKSGERADLSDCDLREAKFFPGWKFLREEVQ